MNAPFAIAGLDHVVLRARNVGEMVRFYRDVLGCAVEKQQPSLGLTQLRAGTSLIDLVDVGGPLGRAGGAAPGETARNMDHFCLRIDPWDETAILAHLQASGAVLGETGRRYGAEGYGPSIYVSDPEGNVVELKGPPEPTP
ncbi:VOC family protein [Emcibacter sp. SYSU 3D8]|uniref:VOC family protein n=1 Tax=Emcibacter sp. SYSU 3D8 TaxID=3133969 RepID=UPI0031FE5189